MKSIGKGMQVFGLILLPLAMLMEFTGQLDREHGVSQMVLMLLFGAAAFFMGRILEGYASR